MLLIILVSEYAPLLQVRGDFETKVGKNCAEFTAVLVSTQVVAGTNFFVKVGTGNFVNKNHIKSFNHLAPKPCIDA